MDSTTVFDSKRRHAIQRVYGLLLIMLVGVGAMWALTVLTRDASAEEGAKGAAPSSSAPYSPDCGHDWAVVSSPNQGPNSNNFNGVAAISANDVWAVGYSDTADAHNTLTEHWNGSTWSVVSSPSPDSNSWFNGVAAISSNDVWAVGLSPTSGTLTEHWDGSTWSVVSSPNPGTQFNELFGVAAISANDVWAVGYYWNGTFYQTLTEHWNGSAWSVVASPGPDPLWNSLNAVAAISANDVWAVGYQGDTEGNSHTLTEHWNGSTWSVVSSPNAGTFSNWFNGVAAVSASDVWAVGTYYNSGPAGEDWDHTLTEHWNGSTWSVVSSPNPAGTHFKWLNGVAAVSASDVWAVGTYDTSVFRTVVEHWNGSSWSLVYSPNQNTSANGLNAVDVVSANDVWAVGSYNVATTQNTLIERYDPCTGTPTPVPTACPIQYTDVAAGSTFYDYVRCLACRGIVSGYNSASLCTTGTPCFLPNNNITRGQMAKFIAYAANYQDPIPPSQQTFTDVPPSHTFWQAIERVHLHGVVSGYTDPARCPTGTPCYLPGNSVTRGQTAKFISIAANYQDPIPPSQQTFTDVPPSHTFWQAIERVYLHGIVTGYQNSPPCTTGTPCYQPANNMTRGQAAKFISKTFFPDCDTP